MVRRNDSTIQAIPAFRCSCNVSATREEDAQEDATGERPKFDQSVNSVAASQGVGCILSLPSSNEPACGVSRHTSQHQQEGDGDDGVIQVDHAHDVLIDEGMMLSRREPEHGE